MSKNIQIYTYENFIEDLSIVKLDKSLKDYYDTILCVMKGGFFLSYSLSNYTNKPIHYAFMISYKGLEKLDLVIENADELIQLKATNLLICEDVVDSGDTLASLCKLLDNVENIHIKSLFAKDSGIKRLQKIDKVKSITRLNTLYEDEWVEFPWEKW